MENSNTIPLTQAMVNYIKRKSVLIENLQKDQQRLTKEIVDFLNYSIEELELPAVVGGYDLSEDNTFLIPKVATKQPEALTPDVLLAKPKRLPPTVMEKQ